MICLSLPFNKYKSSFDNLFPEFKVETNCIKNLLDMELIEL
jgi:hypothetical protein